MVERVLHNLIEALSDAQLIELSAGATPEALSLELLQTLKQRPNLGVSFLNWFTEAIMHSQLVEELFASDDELRRLYHELR